MGRICTGCGPRRRSPLCSLDGVGGSFSNHIIYLPLFTLASLTLRTAFSVTLHFSHLRLHVRTSGSNERSCLYGQVLIALLRVTSTKSYLGMRWLFFFSFRTAIAFEGNRLAGERRGSLELPFVVGAEIDREHSSTRWSFSSPGDLLTPLNNNVMSADSELYVAPCPRCN